MDNKKWSTIAGRILILYLILIFYFFSCKKEMEVHEITINTSKDSTFKINQDVFLPSVLVINLEGEIDKDSSLLIVSYENSKSISNKELGDTIKLYKGKFKLEGRYDLFEPYCILYYKNKGSMKGNINAKVNIY